MRIRTGNIAWYFIVEAIFYHGCFVSGQLHERAALHWLRPGPGRIRRVHRVPQGELLGPMV